MKLKIIHLEATRRIHHFSNCYTKQIKYAIKIVKEQLLFPSVLTDNVKIDLQDVNTWAQTFFPVFFCVASFYPPYFDNSCLQRKFIESNTIKRHCQIIHSKNKTAPHNPSINSLSLHDKSRLLLKLISPAERRWKSTITRFVLKNLSHPQFSRNFTFGASDIF